MQNFSSKYFDKRFNRLMLGVFKMLSCFGKKTKKILPKDFRDNSISGVHDIKLTEKRTKMRSSQIPHKQKVTNIRQQINDGTYNLDEKLDIAIDRLIENILESNN